MSSFTCEASLRRRCLVYSPGLDCIVSAQGPFLESFNVPNWEENNVDLLKRPSRLKVFGDLAAYIETVLTLGDTGFFVVISNLLNDKVNNEFRVYAALVCSTDLENGGYAHSHDRFVISAQPLTERPCTPKFNVVWDTKKLLVLTGAKLDVYQVIQDEAGSFSFPLAHTVSFDTINGLPKGLKPVAVASSNDLHYILRDDSNHIWIAKHSVDGKIRLSCVANNVMTASYIIDDQTSLFADEKEFHVVDHFTHRNEKNEEVDYIERLIAETEGSIVQFELIDDLNNNETIIVGLSQKKIFMYRLDDELTLVGEMETTKNLFTCCTHIHREEDECDPYDLLAVAHENGEVKFVNRSSYMFPRKKMIVSAPADVTNEFVSYFPVNTPTVGYYAVTSTGQFIFRTTSGTEVTTEEIATDMVGISAVCPDGSRCLVAYGRHSIVIHRFSIDPRIVHTNGTTHIATDSFINQCFADYSHFMVSTPAALALVGMCTTERKARGIVVKPAGLDGMNIVSAYDALYKNNKEILLSIVCTSTGSIYVIEWDGDEMKDYPHIQDILDDEPRRELVFSEDLSSPFIESNHEKIVSTANQSIDKELIILGEKGSLIRFRYTRDEGFVILEKHKSSAEFYHLSFSSLIPAYVYPANTEFDSNDFPLIVAYEAPLQSAKGIQPVNIHLLDYKSKDSIFSVCVDRDFCADEQGRNQVYIHGDEEGEVKLFALQTKITAKKKVNKDSVVVFEGIMRKTKRQELVHVPVLPPMMHSLYISSSIKESGKRSAVVVGMSYDEIAVADMNASSGMRYKMDIDLKGGRYEPFCSGMVSTLNGSYLLVGCFGGQVVLIKQPEAPASAFIPPKLILKDEQRIIQIAPFTRSSIDIEKKEELMFTMLTVDKLSVFIHPLSGEDDSIRLVREWKIDLCVDPAEYTLFAMGARLSHHNIWLCKKEEIVVWAGREGKFDSGVHRKDLRVMEGEVSATAVVDHLADGRLEKDSEIPLVEMVCVGTKNGKIGWFYTVRAKADDVLCIQHTMLKGVDVEIKAIEVAVTEAMHLTSPETIEFSACIYALTARRVTVNLVKAELRKKGLSVSQVNQHHLYHLVRDPQLLAVEKSLRPIVDGFEANEKMRRPDSADRVIVSGGIEMETLLMCPKKLHLLKPDLELSPLVVTVPKGTKQTTHLLRNNWSGDIIIRGEGVSLTLKSKACTHIKLDRKKRASIHTITYAKNEPMAEVKEFKVHVIEK